MSKKKSFHSQIPLVAPDSMMSLHLGHSQWELAHQPWFEKKKKKKKKHAKIYIYYIDIHILFKYLFYVNATLKIFRWFLLLIGF